jgi:hypothetical protein
MNNLKNLRMPLLDNVFSPSEQFFMMKMFCGALLRQMPP